MVARRWRLSALHSSLNPSALPRVSCVASASMVFCMLAFFVILKASSIAAGTGRVTVESVYDGDTIKAGGRVIRYIGIDTPEKDEPFYLEARKRNAELLKGRKVVVVVCKGEPVDRYGRTLAWVYADGVLVNGQLLADGLARRFIIPPCGLEKLQELIKFESEAKRAGRGIWR